MNNKRLIPKLTGPLRGYWGLGLAVVLALSLSFIINLKTAKTESLPKTSKQGLELTPQEITSTPPPLSRPSISQVPQSDLTAGWNIYEDEDTGLSISYPPNWAVGKGNRHAPSLPPNTVTFSSKPGTFDFTLVTVEDAMGLPLEDISRILIRSYFGEVEEITVQPTLISGRGAVRVTHFQPFIGGSRVGFSSTIFTSGPQVIWMFTQFEVDPQTNSPLSLEDRQRVQTYELIVQSSRSDR